MTGAPVDPRDRWLDSDAWAYGLLLAAGCLLIAWGLRWAVASVIPGLAFAQDRPVVFQETLRVAVLFFVYLGAAFGAGAVLLRLCRVSSWPVAPLAAVALVLAMAVRWATPDMALDLSPMPDALHHAALASRIVSSGQWTIPVGPHELPSRFSPGPSLLLATVQWMRPDHPGAGIGVIWMTGVMAILTVGWLGAKVYSTRIGVVAALLLASSPSYGHYTRQLMGDVPWSLLILLSLACIYLAKDRGGVLFAGGFLLGLGMLFKPPHVAVVAGTGVCYLLYMARHPRNRWRNAILIGAGFLAGITPWLLYNRLVLGSWILSGYQIYDSNQAAVDVVFGFRYLFGPPIGKGFTGNLIYYPMAALGLDPRLPRMLFLPPVALLLVAGLWYRITRRPRPAPRPAEGQWLLRGVACAGIAYLAMFMFFFCQETRYLLAVLPLFCLGAAVGIDPFVAALGPALHRVLLGLMILVALAMGAAICHVEAEGRRDPIHATWSRLPSVVADADVLLTDEDPVVLGFYGIWTAGRTVVPVIPAGHSWLGEDPHELRRRIGTFQAPYAGVRDAVGPHLQPGKRIAVWLRHPRAHRALLDFLLPEYELKPWTTDTPGGYWLTRSGDDAREPEGAF
jgi:4-amino-4-deoxy-L-arabinose transferase-like glycosyltransferase